MQLKDCSKLNILNIKISPKQYQKGDNKMARQGLTDKTARDEMVVLLEGYPTDDVDATLTEEASETAGDVTEAMELSEPVEDETTTELVELVATWEPKTSEGKKYKEDLKKATQSHMTRQGSDARLDERLGEEHGKESGKEQSYESRRAESRGAKGSHGSHGKPRGSKKDEYKRTKGKKTGDVGGHYKDYEGTSS
jgi:hypothetical protein